MTKLLCFLLLLAAGGLSTLIAATPAAAADSCPLATSQFDAAKASGTIDDIVATYNAVASDASGCGQKVIYCTGNGVALSYLDTAYALAEGGGDTASVESLLLTAKKYGSPWQLLVALADADMSEAQETKDGARFQSAAALYQDAINSINEDPVCAGSALPSPDQIEPIDRRMTEALLLAPQFEIIRTRAGGCGGIFLNSIRGFTPKFRPLPINFEFGKAEFTPAGKKAAEALLGCLKEQSPATITLTGHTDPIGGDAFNMALSQRRLDAVATFLHAGGFAGQLELVAKGETEPFEPDDPTAYTEDQIHQLDRRVALSGKLE